MRQESTQPPLYYATAALATFWIEDDDWQDLVWLNPFWGYNAPGTVNDNKNLILHTERERFPYRGAMLAIHVARLVSVLWGGIAVLATYLIALELFPKRRSFAVGAAALVAFNPQFIFISSAVSNDSAVSALCTLAVWLMLHLVRNAPMTKPQIRDSGWSLGIGHWVLLGLVLGLAILTKVSALALLPLAVIAIAMASWSERSVGAFLSKCAIVFGIVAIVAGWWYVLNWHLHGDPLGIWVHRQLVGPGRPRLTSSQLLHELSQLELSFWASFGMGNVHAHSWIYAVLRVAVRLGAVGLLIQSVNSEPRKFVNSWLRPTNPESTNLRPYQSTDSE
jgi:4-amino-4-deoxy-L-arabinose transferase-like glycosyltransferase